MSRFQKDEPSLNYQTNLEKATIVALCLVILLFLLFPKFNLIKQKNDDIVFTSLNIEDIPVTKHGTKRKPPPKPAIPIPSEDEIIPEDLTIEDTEINFDLFSDQLGTGIFSGRPVIYQPRPIYEVIPEYSQELQKKGIEGMVKLQLHIKENGCVDKVIIIENTTNSELCAKAAKTAALKCRYIPAKSSGKTVDIWITRSYTFGLQR